MIYRGLNKPKRHKSKGTLKAVSQRPCLICGLPPPNDAHHIKSKGSGGDDSLDNLIALCRRHHQEIHKIGRETFFEKYCLFDRLGQGIVLD